MKTPIPITGLWLRSAVGERLPHVEVLLEINGEWRLVGRELHTEDNLVSHIWEVAGIERAKPDPLEGGRSDG